MHIFKTAYSKGGTVEQTIKILKHIKTSYFPDLVPNRYLISWKNGIYNIGEDKFYLYRDQNPYAFKMKPKDDEVPNYDEKVIEALKDLSIKIPKYRSTFEAILHNINPIHRPNDDNGLFTGNNLCSSIYINQDFIEVYYPDKDETGEYVEGYWRSIQTPSFEKLLGI